MAYVLNDRWEQITRLPNIDPVRTLQRLTDAGVKSFFINPPGDQNAYRGGYEHALAFLSEGQLGFTARVPDRFADGGVTLGPSLAILGDNPSGVEMALPSEKSREFAVQIAQELQARGAGGGAPIIIESLVIGDEKIQGPFATRVAGKIMQGAQSHLNMTGMPMNINRR